MRICIVRNEATMAPKKIISGQRPAAELRRQAEAKWSERKQKTGPLPTAGADTRRLVHELQVHQIELEMQNEELVQSRAEVEALLRQYTDLYDFAPIGYFTLACDGAILQVNLAGAHLLGVELGKLIKRRFGVFVSVESRPAFSAFLEKVFTSGSKETCEVALLKDGPGPLWAHMEASTEDKQECRAVVMDITGRKQAEQSLQESEERYRSTLENMMEGCQIIGHDWRYLFINDSAAGQGNLKKEQLIGHTMMECYPGIEKTGMFAELRRCMDDRTSHLMENEFIYPDGSKGYFELSIQPAPNGIFILSNNITERKQADETLQKSEKHFRALVEHSLEEISLVDSHGTLTWESPTSRRPLGYPANSIVGHNLFDLFHPDERAAATQLLEQTVQHPGSVQEALFRLRHRDGSWRWMEGSLTNLLDDPAVQSIVINYRDITEHKRAEQALAESEIKFKWLYEYAPSAYHLLTPDGTLTDVNHRWCELLGYRKEEVLGRAIFDFVVEEERELAKASFEKKKQSRQPFIEGSERNFKTKDGAVRTFKTYDFFALDQRQNIAAVQTTIEDITERKRAEQEIVSLAKFPSENPGPVLRLSRDGIVMYANEASGAFLDMWGSAVGGSAPQFWRDLAAQALANMENKAVDIECDGKIYSMFVSPVAEPGYVNLYGSDITERKQAAVRIRRQLEHLTALSGIDRVISANFDLKLSLSEILNHVTKELGVDAADILILNSGLQLLEYGAERGFRNKAIRNTHVRLGESYVGRAVLERQLIQIPDLREEPKSLSLTTRLMGEDFICYYGVPLIIKGVVKGVLEIFHRTALEPDAEWFDFLNTLAGQAAIAVEIATLFESLQHSNSDLFLAYDATIEGWSHALDLRDKETEGHTQRVTEITLKLARTFGLSEVELVQVRWGALLHDIGKMGVPDGILLKPAPLTDKEWVVMKKHPTFAYEFLAPIGYLRNALDIPYCHHEKWDGSGYPRGLKGTQIPLVARIFAVVDVWDALTSDRPYRAAWPEQKVLDHIRSLSGTHFDPDVVKICLESGMLKG
jgi:PAS domain S-box-containing protein/putative nucleotidyltransferase with HDIG domain